MLHLTDGLPLPWRRAVHAALLGDALGVPHEFKDAHTLPALGNLQLRMSASYPKSHPSVPYGVWSDDGSQMLALLAVLREPAGFSTQRFATALLSWLRHAQYQAGGVVFDCGLQTHRALEFFERHGQPREFPDTNCGNGSLMRVLPVAALPAWQGVSEVDALRIAIAQSEVTHNQPYAAVACALCVELCWIAAADGLAAPQVAVQEAVRRLRARELLNAPQLSRLDDLMAAGVGYWPGGQGSVVNTFWAALWAQQGETLSEVLRRAVSLGGDTDTIACVAGALAGTYMPFDTQSAIWLAQMDLDGY